MTRNGRIAALVLAALMATGGIALHRAAGQGFVLLLFAGLIVVGTVFDAGYRGRNRATHGEWRKTGERELDHETGTIMEVWYDPVSGERRYEPAGSDPTAG
ncbi:MAG: hypothetical protein RIS94_3002 [Pseudomonadota bacterium]